MQNVREIGDEEAKLAIDLIVGELKRRGKAGVIAVGDRHGELIALWRMNGAPLSSVTIAANRSGEMILTSTGRRTSPTAPGDGNALLVAVLCGPLGD